MEATLIYPHQLASNHPGLAPGRPVFLVEEPLLFTEFPTHRQKLLFHYLTMRNYAVALQAEGYTVTMFSLNDIKNSADVFHLLKQKGYTTIHLADTTDDWLEERIAKALEAKHLTRVMYESPLFYLRAVDATARYVGSKRHLARFYSTLRKDTGILMEGGEPEGGAFSFDHDNRQAWPKHLPPPQDPVPLETPAVEEALAWLKTVPGEHYGEALVFLPTTRKDALAWLHEFIASSLASFGPYEDAIVEHATRLHHSLLSPLLNVGLLSVQEVIDAVLAAHKTGSIPLASTEGFIRQVIGWREFIRAAYLVDGRTMRTKNFWQHTAPLPKGFWGATTGIDPLDDTIKKALQFGYTHHIERLMVAGNFLLLTETHPTAVYRWFMAMYVDAYDWVMVPNVYGMSQFADGGLFATKPYISGSNYLRKMSSYKAGAWSETWDGLYWHFIHTHQHFFSSNHRLSMMPKLFAKLAPEKQAAHLHTAEEYLKRAREKASYK